jgi:hypothetical protein
MTRKAFSQYVPSFDAASNLNAAQDEILREIETRKRLYDRWLAEGKITWQEGHDRMTRLMGAHQFLIQCVEHDAELKLESRAN